MEEDEFGGAQRKQFHRQEAISAVADEGFLGDEDDEYDDLYNDVNVGEGFHQTLQRSELGFKNENEGKKMEVVAESRKEEEVVVPPGLVQMGGGGGIGMEEARSGLNTSASSRPPDKFGQYTEPRLDRPDAQVGSLGFRGGGDAPSKGSAVVGGSGVDFRQSGMGGQVAGNPDELNRVDTSVRQAGGFGRGNTGAIVVGGGGGPPAAGGGMGVLGGGSSNASAASAYSGMVLFIGDLHWWTTDADLESEMSKYGQVKEVKFYEEKASGKSKGFAQAEFYDPAALVACQEGMNGHVFNGRPCVVAITSPNNVRRMGEAQMNKNQANQGFQQAQGRRGPGDASGRGAGGIAGNANYQGGDSGRNVGKMGWGRGGQGMMGRGQSGPMKSRVGAGGRGVLSNGGMGNNGGPGLFGQGLATPPLMHPQAMMGQGFDPTYGAPMGRVGGYGGYPGAAPPYTGILPSFPPVGSMPLPGVAAHVNPAFFGRGMSTNGMGMMPTGAVDGNATGLWPDPNMAGWGGDEYGGRTGETSYGEDAASDHGYGDNVSHERATRSGGVRDKDRSSDRDYAGGSERRYRDDRDAGWPREKEAGRDQEWAERRHHDDRDRDRDRDRDHDHDRERDRERERGRERERDRYKDEREKYADHHKHRDREWENEDEWDRGRSSRSHSRSRLLQEEEQRSRPRDADYGKRRRE